MDENEGTVWEISGANLSENIFSLLCQGQLEWNKLSQNPFLAFYQRWPWLCPKYSIHQSLESQGRSFEQAFFFLFWSASHHVQVKALSVLMRLCALGLSFNPYLYIWRTLMVFQNLECQEMDARRPDEEHQLSSLYYNECIL